VLAQKAGVSRPTVSYVEQEVQNPTLDTLLRITAVFWKLTSKKSSPKPAKLPPSSKAASGMTM